MKLLMRRISARFYYTTILPAYLNAHMLRYYDNTHRVQVPALIHDTN
jgi:hypothetical protein